jgi:hypothetical protein
MILLVASALAADEVPEERERRVIPWGTVTAWAFTNAGLAWSEGETARPVSGGGVAVFAGPAALVFSKPKGSTESFRPGAPGVRIDAGLSAGFYARLDTPRASVAGEAGSRTLGGYARLGQMDETGTESRHTLAVGWRSALEAESGQLDVAFVSERRLLPFLAVAGQVDCAFGDADAPWGLGGGASLIFGL